MGTEDKLYIAFIDPGETNGWAVVEIMLHSGPASEGIKLVDAGETTDVEALLQLLDTHGCQCVVYERYVQRASPGAAGQVPVAAQVITQLQKWGAQDAERTLVAQEPAMRKIGTTGKLKFIGWWKVGKPHAQDALRHAFAWLVGQDYFREEIRSYLQHRRETSHEV